MKRPTVLDVLVETRKLLGRPLGWGKHRLRQASPPGESSHTFGPETCYCLYGGMEKAREILDASLTAEAKAALVVKRVILDHYGVGDIIHFNDGPKTRKKDVLHVLDSAIESLKTAA